MTRGRAWGYVMLAATALAFGVALVSIELHERRVAAARDRARRLCDDTAADASWLGLCIDSAERTP